MSSVLRQYDQWVGPELRRTQWIAHDKPGGKAAQRRLRQRAALEAKQRKAVCGVEVGADGRTPRGLIVPRYEPRQVVPGMGGRR